MNIAANSTLLFVGDSITDCGRVRPVGVGDGLGGGYVALVDSLIRVTSPDSQIHVVNTGIGGNTVRDLASRWQSDVLALRPDWLSICIGINDVWRQFDRVNRAAGVPIDEYEATLDKLLAARPAPNLILMTPFFIEPNKSDPMRAIMDTYAAAVKRLAAHHGALLVDTQAAFDRLLAHMPFDALAADRVHPNQTGHLAIARAFLDAVGFD